MKKYYIAPDIDCIDMEPLQVLASSMNTTGTPDNVQEDVSDSEEVGGGKGDDIILNSKENSGGIWEF